MTMHVLTNEQMQKVDAETIDSICPGSARSARIVSAATPSARISSAAAWAGASERL